MIDLRVKEIMKKAVTVDADISLRDAARKMVKENIGCLIIMEDKTIAGIITERDMLKRVCEEASTLEHPVKDFMSRKLIIIEPSEHLDLAASVMSENSIKKLPVVENGKLKGIITSTDIVAHHDDIDDLSFF